VTFVTFGRIAAVYNRAFFVQTHVGCPHGSTDQVHALGRLPGAVLLRRLVLSGLRDGRDLPSCLPCRRPRRLLYAAERSSRDGSLGPVRRRSNAFDVLTVARRRHRRWSELPGRTHDFMRTGTRFVALADNSTKATNLARASLARWMRIVPTGPRVRTISRSSCCRGSCRGRAIVGATMNSAVDPCYAHGCKWPPNSRFGTIEGYP
jgi:hypothetical protein